MDPEIISVQLESLRSVVDGTLKLLSEKGLELEDVFVHRNFAAEQVSALDAVVQDSLVLCQRTGRTDFTALQPPFLGEQVKNVRAIIRDTSILREDGDHARKLTMTSSSFALRLVQSMCVIAVDNIEKCTECGVDPSSLNAVGVDFVRDILRWFAAVVSSHCVSQNEARELDRQATAAEDALAREREGATQRQEAHASRVAEMQTRIADLEESLVRYQTEKVHLESTLRAAQIASLSASNATAAELAAVRAEHNGCAMKLAECQRELAKLKEIVAARRPEAGFSVDSPATATPLRLRISRRNAAESTGAVMSTTTTQRAQPLQSPDDPMEGHEGEASDKQSGTVDNGDGDDTQSSQSEVETALEDIKAKLAAAQRELENSRSEVLKKDNELAAVRRELESLRSTVRKADSECGGMTGQGIAIPVPGASGMQGAATYELTIPPSRVEEIARFPAVKVDIPTAPTGMRTGFTRPSINAVLGGPLGGFLAKCTNSATDLAKRHNILSFLCPSRELNPWLHSHPGHHGYMHFVFEKDMQLLRNGDLQHLFVGVGKWYCYCGEYQVYHVEPVTTTEWASLPIPIKMAHVSTVLSKDTTRKNWEPQDVLTSYDTGKLRLQCVRLQCVGFDVKFYEELTAENARFCGYGGPGVAATENGSSSKRRRLERGRD